MNRLSVDFLIIEPFCSELSLSNAQLHINSPYPGNRWLHHYMTEKHYENLPMQFTKIFFRRKKNENSIGKNLTLFLFLLKTDCGYMLEQPCRGGSNAYPQSMFWSKNKKIRYTPAYLSFTL